jgi:POT family proton-dependent oligopeptide transporter
VVISAIENASPPYSHVFAAQLAASGLKVAPYWLIATYFSVAIGIVLLLLSMKTSKWEKLAEKDPS